MIINNIQDFLVQYQIDFVFVQYIVAAGVVVIGIVLGSVLSAMVKKTILLLFKKNKIDGIEKEQLDSIYLTFPIQMIFRLYRILYLLFLILFLLKVFQFHQ